MSWMDIRPSVHRLHKCAWNLSEFSNSTTLFVMCDLYVSQKNTSFFSHPHLFQICCLIRSLSTVVLCGEWNWDTPFLPIFPCHSLFYSSLPKNTSGVVKQLGKPKCLSKTWWSHETVIIGNELSPSCSSVLQEWICIFIIRLYAGLGIILAKACAVCFGHSDRNMIMNPYLIQIHARPFSHAQIWYLWSGNDQNRGNILWGQIPYPSGTVLFSSSGKRMGYSESVHEPGHFLWSILLSIQNVFIVSVNGYIPIQSF